MREQESGLAAPVRRERRDCGRMDHDASAMDADLRAGMGEAHARIGRGVRKLKLHRVEARGRRRPQIVLAQEPAQKILRAMRRARRQRRKRTPVEHRAVVRVDDQRVLRVERGEIVLQRRSLRLVIGGARECCRITGKRRGESRRDLVANEIALQRHVGVGLVLDPGEPARLGVGGDCRIGQREERTQQCRSRRQAAEPRHRGKAMRTRTAQQLQEQRFGLVAGVMGEHDKCGLRLGEHAIARRAGRRLRSEVGSTIDAHAVHDQRHRALRALRHAERRPLVRPGREPVMDMDGGQRHAMRGRRGRHRIEQHHRIAAARQGDGEGERAPVRCEGDAARPPPPRAPSRRRSRAGRAGRRHRASAGSRAARDGARARGHSALNSLYLPHDRILSSRVSSSVSIGCSCACRSASVSALRNVTMIAA